MRKVRYTYIILAVLASLSARPAGAEVAADAQSAVVLAYQRVGEDSLPAVNVSLERFSEHIRELADGNYNVTSLEAVVAALKPGAGSLPPRTVAITFDGASAATLEVAAPMLKAAGLPYTVFFAADDADAGGDFMTWAQLRDLKRKNPKLALAILPAARTRLPAMKPEAAIALINRAIARYREAFGAAPGFFAWPYGETSPQLRNKIRNYDFKAVFGQQSGVVYPGADRWNLPRFSMTQGYDDLDRFRFVATALPLPVRDIMPEDMRVSAPNPPSIGFSAGGGVGDLSRLSCFATGFGRVKVLRPTPNRVEIRLPGPIEDERIRVNCTLPAGDGAWRWFGLLLLPPVEGGDEAN